MPGRTGWVVCQVATSEGERGRPRCACRGALAVPVPSDSGSPRGLDPPSRGGDLEYFEVSRPRLTTTVAPYRRLTGQENGERSGNDQGVSPKRATVPFAEASELSTGILSFIQCLRGMLQRETSRCDTCSVEVDRGFKTELCAIKRVDKGRAVP